MLSFLNQSGDYAKQLFLQAASGGQLEEQDAGQIEQMQNACEKLREKLEQAWEAGYSAQVQISEYFLEDARYVEPVSYTHLDVYKRQPEYWQKNRQSPPKHARRKPL